MNAEDLYRDFAGWSADRGVAAQDRPCRLQLHRQLVEAGFRATPRNVRRFGAISTEIRFAAALRPLSERAAA